MTVKELELLRYPGHRGHRTIYEFKKNRWFDGWRGDSWCNKCKYKIYSSEMNRMIHFGLGRAYDRTTSDPRSLDMYNVEPLTIK